MTLLPRGVKVHLAFGYIDRWNRAGPPPALTRTRPQLDPLSWGRLFGYCVIPGPVLC
jgi:hypothetical protein